MTKYFCDKCGVEITKANECCGGKTVDSRLGTSIEFTDPATRKPKKLFLELMHAFNSTWNEGVVCKHCVLDAFLRLDDRPKAK